MSIRTLFATLIASAVLVGCSGPNMCEERTDYQAVRETAKIRVPSELDPLPDITQLEIPVSSTPPDEDQTCLERPPRFFAEEQEQEGEAG